MKIQNKLNLLFAGMVAMIVFISCENANRSSTKGRDIVELDEPSAATAAVPTQTDVTKMEREAQLKFRVKDVIQSTGVIEKLAVKQGGYVAKSLYDIDESQTLIKKLSTDSAQEVKKLDQKNHIEVFVLNTKLDSFLIKVQPLVDHLIYRHIVANDVTMENAHSDPEGSKNKVFENQASAQNGGGRGFANDYYQQDSVAQNHKAFATSKPVSIKVLRSRYARVTMDIFQTPVVKKWTIPNPDGFEVARGGFWEDFGSSVRTGWRGMLMVFNFFISFWPVVLLIILTWYLWRRKSGKSFWPAFAFLRKKPK